MISFSDRAILSSIRIEPVDSDEYNQSLVEQLTQYHKKKFLHYVKIEPTILSGRFKSRYQISELQVQDLL